MAYRVGYSSARKGNEASLTDDGNETERCRSGGDGDTAKGLGGHFNGQSLSRLSSQIGCLVFDLLRDLLLGHGRLEALAAETLRPTGAGLVLLAALVVRVLRDVDLIVGATSKAGQSQAAVPAPAASSHSNALVATDAAHLVFGALDFCRVLPRLAVRLGGQVVAITTFVSALGRVAETPSRFVLVDDFGLENLFFGQAIRVEQAAGFLANLVQRPDHNAAKAARIGKIHLLLQSLAVVV